MEHESPGMKDARNDVIIDIRAHHTKTNKAAARAAEEAATVLHEIRETLHEVDEKKRGFKARIDAIESRNQRN
jgi:hypothetical protein